MGALSLILPSWKLVNSRKPCFKAAQWKGSHCRFKRWRRQHYHLVQVLNLFCSALFGPVLSDFSSVGIFFQIFQDLARSDVDRRLFWPDWTSETNNLILETYHVPSWHTFQTTEFRRVYREKGSEAFRLLRGAKTIWIQTISKDEFELDPLNLIQPFYLRTTPYNSATIHCCACTL